MEGAKIEAAECLGQRNRKLVADERSQEQIIDKYIDA